MSGQIEEPLRLDGLVRSKPFRFRLEPDDDTRKSVAEALGIIGIRKLRFEGELVAEGTSDWDLTAKLGATVVQACVATLDPVVTRVDEVVERKYRAGFEEPEGGIEVEMPEDDSTEALPNHVDLGAVMSEALALALPLYPRAEGVEEVSEQFSAPGVAPLSDEAMKPFAGLAELKSKLDDAGEP